MPIQAIENHKIYRQIADQLTGLIASGELAAGARLPSERELAALLGVSRPSVRGGLIALTLAGKIETRGRSGVFVSAPPPPPEPSTPVPSAEPDDLVRPRWVIEGEIAMEAARHAKPEDLRILREAVDEMGQCRRTNRHADEPDRVFHLGIAKATHNSALVSVAERLWEQCRGAAWRQVERHLHTPELLGAMLDDHGTILRALEARNGRRARTAMHRHLERVDREFRRAWQADSEKTSGAHA